MCHHNRANSCRRRRHGGPISTLYFLAKPLVTSAFMPIQSRQLPSSTLPIQEVPRYIHRTTLPPQDAGITTADAPPAYEEKEEKPAQLARVGTLEKAMGDMRIASQEGYEADQEEETRWMEEREIGQGMSGARDRRQELIGGGERRQGRRRERRAEKKERKVEKQVMSFERREGKAVAKLQKKLDKYAQRESVA